MNRNDILFTLVVPVYNEVQGIRKVLEDSLAAFEATEVHPYEIVVVDDGSTDETAVILREFETAVPCVRVLHHESNRGLGAANRTGFGAARGEWVGWIPGDGQFLARDLLGIFKLNHSSADVIIANINPHTRTTADGFVRSVMSKAMRFLMVMFTGTGGNMTGIYLFKNALFEGNAPRITTGLFNILFPYVLEQQGHHVNYQCIPLHPRQTGSSKVANRRTVFKTLSEMFLFRRKYFFLIKSGKTLPHHTGVS